MAVSLDCGGKSAWGWDHPPNKNEISRRLALQTVHAAFAVQGRIPHATACTDPECNSTSVWTGPVFEGASGGKSEVILSFEAFSAEGLVLKNVLSTNPDGSTNNCSARKAGPSCCDGMPPFELWDGTQWARPKAAEIRLVQNRVVINVDNMAAVGSTSKVRYAWADYIDCVLANSDGLPAGPFVANITAARGEQAGNTHPCRMSRPSRSLIAALTLR